MFTPHSSERRCGPRHTKPLLAKAILTVLGTIARNNELLAYEIPHIQPNLLMAVLTGAKTQRSPALVKRLAWSRAGECHSLRAAQPAVR